MISGLEQNLINIRNTTAKITMMLLKGEPIEKIVNELKVSAKKYQKLSWL
ncbi:hypothetical protein [Robertmurraya korlensis]|nr:hypothetical protein [Robertmurraya korlensis]